MAVTRPTWPLLAALLVLLPACRDGAARPERGAPLVLISIDTLRSDRLPAYGYDGLAAPRIDALAADSVLYERAYSHCPLTLPSHASLFTGLFPGQHEATHTRRDPDEETVLDVRWPAQRLRDDVPTLAERLAEVGYQTAAIVSNSFYVGHEFGLDRGFEHFDDRPGSFVGHDLALVQMAGLRPRTGHLAYRDAERIGALARRWLDRKRRDRPFFLFINFMDAHWPFVPPPPFDRAFDDERPDRPLRPTRPLQALQYDRELLYLDHHVAALLDHLEQTGLVDGSLIVITSDHGEAFGEHGFHRHDKMLYEEVIKVPLYVKRPGAKSGGLSDEPVTGTDVYRMILRELGLPAPAPAAPRGMIGEWYRSQRMIRRSQAAAARGIVTADDLGPHDLDRDLIAWLDGSTKWIVSSRGAVEAYDLAADPGERRPLTPTADRIESAVARATAWWTAHPPQGTVNDEPIDEETRRRLRSLGYLD